MTTRKLNSFVSVQPPIQAIDSSRLTVCPVASFSTKVSSRVFLILCRNFRQRIVPGNVLPFRAARPAHLRLHKSALIQDLLFERGALRTQRAAVGGMIRIAVDMNYLRCNILRAVSDRVDDRPATHRTIRTCGPRLVGAGNLQNSKFGVGGLQVESKDRGSCAANRCKLQKIPA